MLNKVSTIHIFITTLRHIIKHSLHFVISHTPHSTAVQPVPKTVPLPLTTHSSIHRSVTDCLTIRYVTSVTAFCITIYRGADKSLARPTSPSILFDGENISFDASLVIYINSTNIPPIMIINRIYETHNLLSLLLVSFLVGLRTYQHPCTERSGDK